MGCPCPPPMTGNNCPCGQRSYTIMSDGTNGSGRAQRSAGGVIDFDNSRSLNGLVQLSSVYNGNGLRITPTPGFTSRTEILEHVIVALVGGEELILPIHVRHNGDFVELITPEEL